jgi:hypothetical protein
MSVYEMFDINHCANAYLDKNEPWKTFSHYFMFLTLRNGGCHKMSSGTLQISFPQHWEEAEQRIEISLGGYDCRTMSRHENFIAATEEEAKEKLMVMFEKERLAILNPVDDDIHAF